MLISVYRKITEIKSREDKKILAKYASNPYLPEKINVDGIKDLISVITKFGWSPSIFKEFRLKANFISADFLVLDIDSDLNINDCLKRVTNLNIFSICLPTYSHSHHLNKYRLVFPLCSRITKQSQYQQTMMKLFELFPEADPSCVTDEARMYYPCNLNDDGFIYEGQLLKPEEEVVIKKDNFSSKKVEVSGDIQEIVDTIYGESKTTIPECVQYFIVNAHTGLPGMWNTSLNKFCFTLALQGVNLESIESIVENLAPEPLDSKDLYTIQHSHNDGVLCQDN